MNTLTLEELTLQNYGKTEEELFAEYAHYVPVTIKKKFKNMREFCAVHMIEQDDLIQLGNIGLIQGIRNYNPKSNKALTSHLIDSIVWAIKTKSKKESLRNINTQTFEVANIISASTPVGGEDEELTVIDTIQSDEDITDIKEASLENILEIEYNKAEDSYSKEIIYIAMMRLQEKTFADIGKELGVSAVSIHKKLTTRKAKKVIDELLLKVKGE